MKIHHIGYLVPSIEISVAQFQKIGYKIISPCIFDEGRKIFIQFLQNTETYPQNNGGVLELVMPAGDCTLFPPRLLKLGTMPYHICYECQEIEKTISELCDTGFILIRELSPAPAIENRRVAFLYGEGVGQIELLEGENF